MVGMVMADDHQIDRFDAEPFEFGHDLFGWTGIDQCRLTFG